MYFKTLLTCLLALILTNAHSQEINHSCGFDHWRHHVKETQPDLARDIDERYQSWIEQSRYQQRVDTVYQIPVVFHIVHNTPEQNLPDSVVHSQLEVLNEDYRRLNANSVETREEFLPVAADVGIEFVLADFDPEGNPTDGIVRVETDRENFELDFLSQDNTLDEVKFSETGGSNAWNTDAYLNIWVCNISGGFLGQVFGLAYPPEGVPNWPDDAEAPSSEASGVIIHFTTLGRNNPHHALDDVAENNQGRTLVHEIGHYLGLRHIWGDAIPFLGEDGCEADDGLADTPNAAAADNFACNLTSNSCTDSPEDFPDMIENYMDYSQDACMNMFTQEQADMMRFALTELRPGLINSPAVGVEESTFASELLIFPNPTEHRLSIESPMAIDQLELLDQTGRQLMHYDNLNGARATLSVEGIASGSYFLRILAGGEVAVKKIAVK